MRRILVIFLLLSTKYLLCNGQSITEGPVNTAVNVGSQTVLNCTANVGGDTLQWRRHFNYTDILIWDSNTGDIEDERFEVNVDEAGGHYDLVIKVADEELGGPYYVKLVASNKQADVELVVLGGLGCNPSQDFPTQEGANIMVECDTTYFGFMEPTMKVFYGKTEIPTYPKYLEENYKSVRTNFTAKPEHDGTSYECRLSFEGNEEEVPIFHDNCTTGVYTVYYGIHNMTIHPDVSDVKQGDYFNCTAVSNPGPITFQWFCHDRTYWVPGNILEVNEDLLGFQECICNAQCEVNGQPKQKEMNITFTTVSGQYIQQSSTFWMVLFLIVTFTFTKN